MIYDDNQVSQERGEEEEDGDDEGEEEEGIFATKLLLLTRPFDPRLPAFCFKGRQIDMQRFKTLSSCFRLPHDLDDRRPPAASDAPSAVILLLGHHGSPRHAVQAGVVVLAGRRHDDVAAQQRRPILPPPVGPDLPRPDRLRLRRGLGPQDDRGDVPAAAVPLPQEMRQYHR